MMSLSLSLKTAVIAGVTVAGTAGVFYFVASTRNGDTAVQGAQMQQQEVGQQQTVQQQQLAADRKAPPQAAPSPLPTPRNNGNGNSDGNGPGQGGGVQNGTFQIAGDVVGLHPGASRPLQLTFSNPAAFAIRVTELEVVAADSNASGCSSENLVTPTETTDLVVPGNGSSTYTVTVEMIADPDDACQAATWTLTYSATAVKA